MTIHVPYFRSVFPFRKKTKDREEIVHKKFVLSENTYYFGPLHCGKTRDRYVLYVQCL